jgi:hypothetical protein
MSLKIYPEFIFYLLLYILWFTLNLCLFTAKYSIKYTELIQYYSIFDCERFDG